MRVDLDREVALVGGGIAATAGAVLLASMFTPWYQKSGFCDFGDCGVDVNGFSALGGESAVLAGAALGAWLMLAAALREGRASRLLAGISTVAGFGAALLILFRIAAVPRSVTNPTGARFAGVFVGLLGAAGVIGGSALTGIGRRLFDRAPAPAPTLVVIVAGSGAMIASLFTPWVRGAPGFGGRAATQTAWQVSPTLAGLLAFGAVAIILASGLVALIRWRAAFFALAVGGWLAAAIAATATVLATRTRDPRGLSLGLTPYAPGYYVFLGAAGVVVLAALWAAIGKGPVPSRG